ncbi:hypothetical protein Tco_0026173 [Tanacetum coccineum]
MTTLAKFMIVVGAENRPPMLDKPQYESWKSHMELYIQGKDHGRIIRNSVKNGPLIWPTVEQEDDTVRLKIMKNYPTKKSFKLIVISRVKLLMQGTSLVKQERECKLYDEFDNFSHVKVNTKFMNSLPTEWSKFVTDVKLARDLHTSNYDQLYAYLEQYEPHANEALLMHERFPDLLALVANYHQPQSHFNNYHLSIPLLRSQGNALGLQGNTSGQAKVMVAPIIPIFAGENLGDPIEIRVDIVYPTPVTTVAFLVVTVMRTLARHGEVIGGIQERLLEMPTQRWEEIKEELLTLRVRANRS